MEAATVVLLPEVPVTALPISTERNTVAATSRVNRSTFAVFTIVLGMMPRLSW